MNRKSCSRCGAVPVIYYRGDDGAECCLKCLTSKEYNQGKGLLKRLVIKEKSK